MHKTNRSSEKEFVCPMCNKRIDLNGEETIDENGQVMHERCYLKHVAGHEHTPPDAHHTE